jgi:hypothetical protein
MSTRRCQVCKREISTWNWHHKFGCTGCLDDNRRMAAFSALLDGVAEDALRTRSALVTGSDEQFKAELRRACLEFWSRCKGLDL